MRVVRGFASGGFSPGEQFMGRDRAFPHLQVLVGVEDHRFPEFFRMCQEELDVEGTPPVEYLRGLIQVRSFARIGSALGSFPHVKEQLGGPFRLPHFFPRRAVHIPEGRSGRACAAHGHAVHTTGLQKPSQS